MKALQRRVDALDHRQPHWTLGEMLDSLNGEPLPASKSVDPAIEAALDVMPKR